MRAVVHEPVQAAIEDRHIVDHVGLDGFDREQRQQAHQRAHLEGRGTAVGQMQDIVEEALGVVPEAVSVVPGLGHGIGDAQEVFEQLGGRILVDGVVLGQLQGNLQQRQTVGAHPGGAVRLVDVPAGGQHRAAVEHADVVHSQEPALEHVVALFVLAIDPPGEVQQQLVKHPFQKRAIRGAGHAAVDLVDAPRGPGVDRRVDVAERPLVGGELAVWMHVPLAGHQFQLPFGEVGIDQGQRDAMEGQIPRGVPRVLPLVGHRDDVEVGQMIPVLVASPAAAGRWRVCAGIALEPLLDVVVVELFRPQHPGERLPLHVPLVGAEPGAMHGVVELLRFVAALREGVLSVREWVVLRYA